MNEAAQKINRLERNVAWRMRLLALQDKLALALLAGGMISAAAILYIRLRPLETPAWIAAVVILGASIAIALGRWFTTRATERDAAFAIDRALDLEDRITTARAVIERGGPERAVEVALVDDAAGRVAEARPSKLVPYTLSYRQILGLLGAVALAAAVLIPERSLPGGEALAEARADIQTAGERLEQTAQEVEQIAPPGTETAKLAIEQADLGRTLRRSIGTRAEALKKLSALEERIRERHDELASTRADEIVNLAEKRLAPALAEKSKATQQKSGKGEDSITQTGELKGASPDASDAARNQDAKQPETNLKSDPPDSKKVASNARDGASKSASEPKTEKDTTGQAGGKSETGQAGDNRAGDKTGASQISSNRNQSADKQVADGQSKTGERAGEASGKPETQSQQSGGESQTGDKTGEQQKTGDLKVPSGMTDFMAKQAARGLSDQLLKKAAELRADQLSAEDIKRLAQAAESLARDLAPIAQSKEFQQTLEQLARQVNAEQLEQMARQLMSQEKIRKELEAAARLLIENREAKEIASGMAEKFGDKFGEMRARNQKEQQPGIRTGEGGGQQGQSRGHGNSRVGMDKINGDSALAGQGKEKKLGGRLQRNSGGEYLYLEAKPGAGAVRVPYESAYPQYRREAERSVERSQIPPRMRSVVRDYFDSINPDAKKKN